MNDTTYSPSILSYFSSKRVLLIDQPKSLRATFKRVFRNLSVPINDVESFEGELDELKATLLRLNPHIIISPLKFHTMAAVDIMKLQRNSINDEINRAFFILTPENSTSNATVVLDNEFDGCLCEPFTNVGIEKSILEALTPKINATPFLVQYFKIRQTLRVKPEAITLEAIKALEHIEHSRPYRIALLKGEYWVKREDFNKAEEAFEEAHCRNPKAYLPLKLLAETAYQNRKWDVAYEARRKILEQYPVNPETIPELIKLSVANEHFDEVFHYLKIFDELELKSRELEMHISAGLALCGKYLMQLDQKDKAVASLKRAVEMCHGKLEVIKLAVTLLLEHGIFSVAKEILLEHREKFADSVEFRVVEMQVLSQSRQTLPLGLKIGLELLAKGKRELIVYQNVIRLAIMLKRKPDFIQELFDDAIRHFPQSQADFEMLVQSMSEG
jgi:tetratricopeptide (TPR) repeat protein